MSGPSDLERRVTELEIKAGFADDLLDQLNQTIYRQQQQIDLLLREVADLRRHLTDGPPGPAGSADERPPHY